MSADERIDEEVSQSDLVHERLRESPFKRWVVLGGNRYALTGAFSVVERSTSVRSFREWTSKNSGLEGL
ncbi:hypothetical protein [Natronorubrum sp. DTA7]|uniref:hypothetical protein n=1 Tax=Natronorubrum sp. DTA7 TaxID=3447016 RepID=UPI003F83CC3C